MFESVKQGVQQNTISYFVSFLVSIITHAVILGVIVSLPLIFYSPLKAYTPAAWFIESPDLSKKAPPPPPPSSSSAVKKEDAGPDQPVYKGPLAPPPKIPDGIPPPENLPAPAGINRP